MMVCKCEGLYTFYKLWIAARILDVTKEEMKLLVKDRVRPVGDIIFRCFSLAFNCKYISFVRDGLNLGKHGYTVNVSAIISTVVLTNAAQAKYFPLSMPITCECSYTSDLEHQLCLEPNGDQWNLVSNTNTDLRTASQFRHGALSVLTSPIWVALFIMRSKHRKKFHWPRLQLRNRVVHSFTYYRYTVHSL